MSGYSRRDYLPSQSFRRPSAMTAGIADHIWSTWAIAELLN
jgi:hypothetical protein